MELHVDCDTLALLRHAIIFSSLGHDVFCGGSLARGGAPPNGKLWSAIRQRLLGIPTGFPSQEIRQWLLENNELK